MDHVNVVVAFNAEVSIGAGLINYPFICGYGEVSNETGAIMGKADI
jgi:hypothetical protein